MKKIIAIILSLFTLLSLCTPIFAANNQTALTTDETTPYHAIPNIRFNIEKNTVPINERIVITLPEINDLKISSIQPSADGFQVFGKESSSKVTQPTYELLFNSSSNKAYFSCLITTIDNQTFICELFAIKENNTVYCSLDSFDSAKDNYFYSYVTAGLWTEAEYQVALREYYQCSGTEERTLQFDNSPKSSAHTTISGTLSWKDDNNRSHPLRYVKVEIWDNLFSTKMMTLYTDSSGNYSYSVYDTQPYRNIFIRVYPGGDYATARTATGNTGGTYTYQSATEYQVQLGSALNISWTADMSDDLGKVFQISQAVITAAMYAETMEGYSLPSVNIVYPAQTRNFNYDPDFNQLNICYSPGFGITCYASWDAIMHEYGHHVMWYFDIEASSILDHNFTENLLFSNVTKSLAIHQTWNEAYPTIFALIAQRYYRSDLSSINTVADTCYTAFNYSSYDIEAKTGVYGDACEGAVAGVLWDIFDIESEAHDQLRMSHTAFWNVITQSESRSFSEFVSHFNSTQSDSAKRKLGEILSHYRIAAFNLSHSISNSTASFSWDEGGTSTNTSYQNNRFSLVFCDANGVEIFRISNISSSNYTLTSAAWASILGTNGTTFGYYVIASQTSSPTTGPYQSEYISVVKPS